MNRNYIVLDIDLFKLPEFSMSKDMTFQVDMDGGKLEDLDFDMIIVRDLLQAPKVIVL